MEMGGVCTAKFDAFLVVAAICISIGLIWLILFRSILSNLQTIPKSQWLVSPQLKNNNSSLSTTDVTTKILINDVDIINEEKI